MLSQTQPILPHKQVKAQSKQDELYRDFETQMNTNIGLTLPPHMLFRAQSKPSSSQNHRIPLTVIPIKSKAENNQPLQVSQEMVDIKGDLANDKGPKRNQEFKNSKQKVRTSQTETGWYNVPPQDRKQGPSSSMLQQRNSLNLVEDNLKTEEDPPVNGLHEQIFRLITNEIGKGKNTHIKQQKPLQNKENGTSQINVSKPNQSMKPKDKIISQLIDRRSEFIQTKNTNWNDISVKDSLDGESRCLNELSWIDQNETKHTGAAQNETLHSVSIVAQTALIAVKKLQVLEGARHNLIDRKMKQMCEKAMEERLKDIVCSIESKMQSQQANMIKYLENQLSQKIQNNSHLNQRLEGMDTKIQQFQRNMQQKLQQNQSQTVHRQAEIENRLRKVINDQLKEYSERRLKEDTKRTVSIFRKQAETYLQPKALQMLRAQLHSELRDKVAQELKIDLHQNLKKEVVRPLQAQLSTYAQNQFAQTVKSQAAALKSSLQASITKQLNGSIDTLKTQWNSMSNGILYAKLKDELEQKLNKDLQPILINKMTNPLRDSLFKELKSDIYSELKTEIGQRLTNDLPAKLRGEVCQSLKGDLLSQLKHQVIPQMQISISYKLKNELEQEMKGDFSEKLKLDLGEKLRVSISDKLRVELQEQVKQEVTSELTPLLERSLSSRLSSELKCSLGGSLFAQLNDKLSDSLFIKLKSSLFDLTKSHFSQWEDRVNSCVTKLEQVDIPLQTEESDQVLLSLHERLTSLHEHLERAVEETGDQLGQIHQLIDWVKNQTIGSVLIAGHGQTVGLSSSNDEPPLRNRIIRLQQDICAMGWDLRFVVERFKATQIAQN